MKHLAESGNVGTFRSCLFDFLYLHAPCHQRNVRELLLKSVLLKSELEINVGVFLRTHQNIMNEIKEINFDKRDSVFDKTVEFDSTQGEHVEHDGEIVQGASGQNE